MGIREPKFPTPESEPEKLLVLVMVTVATMTGTSYQRGDGCPVYGCGAIIVIEFIEGENPI